MSLGTPLARLVDGLPAGFLRNFSWQSAASLYTVASGFAYTVVVGHALGVAEFGLMALGLGFGGVVFQCVELRLQEAVIRYVAEFWERHDGARTLATVKLAVLVDALTGLLAMALVAAGAPWAREHLLRDSRGVYIVVLSGLAVFSANVATATALGLLRVFERFGMQATVTMAGATLKLLATIVALWALGWRVEGVLVIALVTGALTNAVLVGVALRELHRHVPLWSTVAPIRLLHDRMPEMRRFVRNTYLLSVAMIPTKDLDVNILGLVGSAPIVGVYKVAKSFLVALFAISDAAFLVVYPELARLWARRQFAAIGTFLRRLTIVMGVGGLATYVAGFLAVPFAIHLLLGSSYAPAGTLFRWMGGGVVFWAPLVWVNPLLMAAGRADLTLAGSILGSVIVLGLYLVLVPMGGAVAAAVVYALATPVVLGLILALGWRFGPLASVLSRTGRTEVVS